MDRRDILQKLAAGEITADEAVNLLEGKTPEVQQPQESTPQPQAESMAQNEPGAPVQETVNRNQQRWLHVRVTDMDDKHDHVRVNIPLGVVEAGLWVGSRFSHRFRYGRWAELIDAIREGATGTLVEVEDADKGERVHIYVD
ncbi:MAG: hypothetical protein IT324_19350 [Anaerolineae bacterium]|nr:hypothetical protein [Anaerolineae bacterium]